NGNGVEEVKDSRTSLDGSNHDLLSTRLKYDFEIIKQAIENNYNYLNNKIERVRNVNDYGADPTGEKDSTQAFKEALGNGNVHVHMTEGIYKVTGIKYLITQFYLVKVKTLLQSNLQMKLQKKTLLLLTK